MRQKRQINEKSQNICKDRSPDCPDIFGCFYVTGTGSGSFAFHIIKLCIHQIWIGSFGYFVGNLYQNRCADGNTPKLCIGINILF